MRALIVSHSYRPQVSPRAFRWTALAEKWAAEGHEIDVVCNWSAGLPRVERLDGVCVHRTGGSLADGLRRRLLRCEAELPALAATTTAQTPFRAGPLERAARLLHDVLWKPFYWPDYACLWNLPAMRTALALLKTRPYDALISVSLPFTAHLVGRQLKTAYPRLPWLVDVGDPFCFPGQAPLNNQRLYGRRNQRTERQVFERVDAISVTTPRTRLEYGRIMPGVQAKIHVIPPLAPQLDDDAFAPPRGSEEGRIKLVFLGTLYRSIRNPQYLLRLFQALRQTHFGDRLELHFVGAVHDCAALFEPYRDQLGRTLFLHGQVDRQSALEHMRRTDVLVNLGNRTAYQLPSKVVEYAAARKPVLNLASIRDDSSADFFDDHPLAMTIFEESGTSLAMQARRVCKFIGTIGDRQTEDLDAWLEPYRIERISAAYESVLGGMGVDDFQQETCTAAGPAWREAG